MRRPALSLLMTNRTNPSRRGRIAHGSRPRGPGRNVSWMTNTPTSSRSAARSQSCPTLQGFVHSDVRPVAGASCSSCDFPGVTVARCVSISHNRSATTTGWLVATLKVSVSARHPQRRRGGLKPARRHSIARASIVSAEATIRALVARLFFSGLAVFIVVHLWFRSRP